MAWLSSLRSRPPRIPGAPCVQNRWVWMKGMDELWWFINVYNPQIWWILMVYKFYNESPYSNCHKLGVHHFQTNPDRFWMVKLGHCGCFLFYFFWMNKRSVPVYKPLSWAFRLRWILGWVLFRSHSIERTAYVCEKAGARLACQSMRFCAAPLPQDWFFRCDDGSKIGARLDPQSRLLYVWSVNSSSFWGPGVDPQTLLEMLCCKNPDWSLRLAIRHFSSQTVRTYCAQAWL